MSDKTTDPNATTTANGTPVPAELVEQVNATLEDMNKSAKEYALRADAVDKQVAEKDAERSAQIAELTDRVKHLEAKGTPTKFAVAQAKAEMQRGQRGDNEHMRSSLLEVYKRLAENAGEVSFATERERRVDFLETLDDDFVASLDRSAGDIPGSVEKLQSAGVNNQGGYLSPEQFQADLIKDFKAASVTDRAGVRKVQVAPGTGSLVYPKKTNAVSAYWVAESGAPTSSTLTFGALRATAKKLAAYVPVTRSLIRQSGLSVEQIVREDFAIEMALAKDLAVLRGAGSANEPLGIANAANIGSVEIGTNGGQPTYAKLRDLEYDVLRQNVLGRNLAWITHPAVWNQINKILDQDNRPLYGENRNAPPAPALMADGMLHNHPLYTTTQLPTNLTKGTLSTASELYFGDWWELLCFDFSSLEVRVFDQAYDATNSHNAALQDLMFFVVFYEMDTIVRHDEAFALMNDVASQD